MPAHANRSQTLKSLRRFSSSSPERRARRFLFGYFLHLEGMYAAVDRRIHYHPKLAGLIDELYLVVVEKHRDFFKPLVNTFKVRQFAALDYLLDVAAVKEVAAFTIKSL
jgi:hypothetical protein